MRLHIATILLLACLPSLYSQTSRGTITGIVKDPSGAAVPTAEVELRSVERETVRSTKTNESGLYRFDAVDPGTYRIAVIAGGFSRYETSVFNIAAAQVASVDAKLEVGEQTVRIEVTEAVATLQTEAPVRGGAITEVQSTQLPIPTRNPVSLALTLPGVSSNRGGPGVNTFSVNGGRGRSNNFLLDGTENNDISIAGQAFEVTNPDAVREVSVQTGNYDAEFGRAGGAVVNTIIRSGTNDFHGSAGYLIESTRFNAITNTQSLDPGIKERGTPPPGTDQWFNATIGGPIRKNKTFFFGAFQDRRQASTSTGVLTTLSQSGRDTLRSLFPEGRSANVDLYLKASEGTAANSQFSNVQLGNGRPDLEFGTYIRSFAQKQRSYQPIVKVDHIFGERDTLMARMAFSDFNDPTGASAPRFIGFDTALQQRYQNYLVTETHVFSPTLTNELRLPYNRVTLGFPLNPQNPLGETLGEIQIQGLSFLGVNGAIPQGRVANNYGLQDTMSWVKGTHSFRFGLDLLAQRARQFAPFAPRGVITYQAGGGFSSFANFVDDFGGSNGANNKDFGSNAYYPDMFRQAYFFQDRWRATNDLTLTLGIRYENFGTPINSVGTAAYAGLFNVDPATGQGPYARPSRVDPDNNNFSPTIGVAWSPSFDSGILGMLLGQKKFVWRMGYQIGYDSFYNNIASNAQSSAPNIIATQVNSTVTTANPRGTPNWSNSAPRVARPVSPLDAQTLAVKNLRNPYYQRWSGGFQRQLPYNLTLDMSYVGSKGTKLFGTEDFNPLVPTNFRVTPAGVTTGLSGRLDNIQGGRNIRTNIGDSNFHSFQTELRRRWSNGFMFSGAYTRAKFIDNGADIFNWTTFTSATLAAVPSIFGGQPAERSLSSFDRPNRAVFTFVYDLPFMKSQRGLLGRAVGGWQVSGVTTFESGVPASIVNGVDADGFGGALERPMFNPSGQLGVRAQPNATSPTGYVNPEANNAAINPSEAMFIGLPTCNISANPNGCPNGNLGKNTWRGPGVNNWNVNILKVTNLTERFRTELRGEFFNFFNHPQYGSFSASAFAPPMPAFASNVAGSLPGRFLQPQFLDGGGRVVRFGLKLLF